MTVKKRGKIMPQFERTTFWPSHLPPETIEKSGVSGVLTAWSLTGGKRSKKSEKQLTGGMGFAIVAAHTVN
jgi:hypothetical protein